MHRIISAFHALLLLPLFANVSTADDRILPQGFRADEVVVHKARRELQLLKGTDTIKTYRISLGKNPIGPKIREGDGRTPEGIYRIDWRNSRSTFHLSLHISYPDSSDVARAKQLGLPPGGMIMIHGLTNSLGWIGKLHLLSDWTDGCIAVTNPEIEELWRCIPDGTTIILLP